MSNVLEPRRGSVWTEEREKILVEMWREGKSASEIADRLAAGLSRNAVIGKLHRLGESKRHGEVAKKSRRPNVIKMSRPRVARVIAAAPTLNQRAEIHKLFQAAPLPEDEVTGPRVSFDDLEPFHCRYVYGDPRHDKDWGYCSHTKVAGLSYCERHVRRCYQPPQAARSSHAVTPLRRKVYEHA